MAAKDVQKELKKETEELRSSTKSRKASHINTRVTRGIERHQEELVLGISSLTLVLDGHQSDHRLERCRFFNDLLPRFFCRFAEG